MIAILSGENDVHYQHVKNELEKRGEDFVLMDFSKFPSEMLIGFQANSATDEFCVEINGRLIQGKDIKAVWNRRKGHPVASKNISTVQIKEYVNRESQFFLDSLPQLLPRAFWVSNPDAISIASRKPYQLLMAKRVGFNIPETLIGNSPSQIKKFIEPLDEIAVKALCVPSVKIEESQETDSLVFYTKRINKKTLEPLLNTSVNCPTIFQKYIEKELELRITVVGEKVFTCAIYSQQSQRTREDWRRYDLFNTPHKPYLLSKEIEDKCLALVKNLNLVFGCIDMIVAPSGEYVFLEINPNGQWLWIEKLTNIPIGEELAKMLVAGRIT
ncbi:MAG: MvdC/MvdD family ATP grasp protein [Patescibacteria group bacterium]